MTQYSNYDLQFAGVPLVGAFQFPETAGYFNAYCTGISKQAHGLKVPEQELKV